ncbi:MAG: hypothetical protein HQ556_01330 [Candidatus Marinimicrobia bacterium]|nr:hypothetical protein [Candidatus Neomarinimicrobiota bacterium]
MSLSSIKHLIFITLILSFSSHLCAGDGFPAWDRTNLFKQDLRRATLVTNMPNITESDHFIGVQFTGSQIFSNSGSYQRMPAARLSMYPNPGYNLWVQFARWPGSNPNFSVGTGLQVEFKGEDLQRRQAIGISWNSIFDDGYIQRDISLHGLYAYDFKKLNLGVITIIDLHHLVVEDGNGIPDYDETILLAVPYISWLIKETFRVSVMVPYNSTGPGLVLGSELLIGKRK